MRGGKREKKERERKLCVLLHYLCSVILCVYTKISLLYTAVQLGYTGNVIVMLSSSPTYPTLYLSCTQLVNM